MIPSQLDFRISEISLRHGQAPYGFRWQGGKLLVVPGEARIRRLALETMLRLRSCAAVARELNEWKEPTRRGGEWSDVQVARILSCPSAIGRYLVGEGKEGAHDSEILLCEALVSETVWKQVQAILRGREKRKAAPTANEAPLFAGMLWCGCGKRLHFHPDSGRGDCNECDVRVSHTEIEGVFAEDFFALVSSIPQLIGALCQPSEFRNLAGEVAELQHQLDSARAKQALAEKLLGESSITSRRFDEIHGPIEEEIRAAELHLTKLKAKLSNQPQPSPRISPDEWQLQWAAWPTSRRRQIVQAFVERITVRPGEIEIAYLLSDSSSKETSPVQQISHPTFQTHPGQPTYIRLPKPGEKCPITGLSRAKLNELILPNERNENNPPVASKSLRQKGAQRGIRLVLLESLLAYLLGKS